MLYSLIAGFHCPTLSSHYYWYLACFVHIPPCVPISEAILALQNPRFTSVKHSIPGMITYLSTTYVWSSSQSVADPSSRTIPE